MIYANIASLPDRLECLEQTIESIYNQVDEINIGLNNYKELPFNDKKINQVLLNNEKGDAAKLYFKDKCDGWFFMMDDDLIFPKDYVRNTMKQMPKAQIVTYHGRSFYNRPISSYYRDESMKFRCLGDVFEDSFVQIGGTGVMCFHTNDLKINYNEIGNKNMLDLVVSAAAKRQNKKILCAKHKRGWIKYNPKMWEKETIYDVYKKNDTIQTDFYNNFC